MKKNWPYILVLLVVMAFLFRVSKQEVDKKINWNPDYTGYSRSPLGCYVAKDYLGSMLSGGMDAVDKSAYEQLAGNDISKHNYVFVNDKFEPTKEDVKQLCRFVSDGNTVFVSANNFDYLSDTLGFDVDDPLMMGIAQDSILTFNSAFHSSSQFVESNLVNPSLKLSDNAVFVKTHNTTVFVEIDTLTTTVLGTEENKYVNFVKIKFGEGNFFIHTLPDAFANYYAADRGTAPYLFRVLSYLPNQSTFFDEHYKAGYVENDDTRRYILSVPALRLGYLVAVITGLIALFFGGKRRQRPVPLVAAPTNATLEFVEQIGVLYYRQGNHGDIVRKKTSYFLESIRSRFYVQTNVFDEKFLERIQNLSAIPRDQVQHLFARLDYFRIVSTASEKDLKEIEELIRDFNQRSKR
jgi:hypothetical protein